MWKLRWANELVMINNRKLHFKCKCWSGTSSWYGCCYCYSPSVVCSHVYYYSNKCKLEISFESSTVCGYKMRICRSSRWVWLPWVCMWNYIQSSMHSDHMYGGRLRIETKMKMSVADVVGRHRTNGRRMAYFFTSSAGCISEGLVCYSTWHVFFIHFMIIARYSYVEQIYYIMPARMAKRFLFATLMQSVFTEMCTRMANCGE